MPTVFVFVFVIIVVASHPIIIILLVSNSIMATIIIMVGARETFLVRFEIRGYEDREPGKTTAAVKSKTLSCKTFLGRPLPLAVLLRSTRFESDKCSL